MAATLKTVKPYPKRPGGPYYYKFAIGGVEYRRCTGTINKREAEEITRAVFAEATRRALNDKVAQGRAPGKGRVLTLDHAAEAYVQANPKIVPGTKTGNETIRRLKVVGEAIGYNMPVTDIRTKQVSDFVVLRRRTITRTGKPPSPATILGEVGALQAVLTHCVKVEECDGMPAIDWGRVRPKLPGKEIRRLSIKEQVQLISKAPLDHRRVIEFFLETGFRRTNMIELTWSEVHEDAIEIKQKRDKIHAIPITGRLQSMLDVIPRYTGIDQVFTFVAQRSTLNPKTKQRYVKGQRYSMTYYGFGTWFKRHRVKQGIRCTIHDLRRTHGSETMVEVGIEHASKALGHSSIKVTEEYYANFIPAERRAAAERAAEARKAKFAALNRPSIVPSEASLL